MAFQTVCNLSYRLVVKEKLYCLPMYKANKTTLKDSLTTLEVCPKQQSFSVRVRVVGEKYSKCFEALRMVLRSFWIFFYFRDKT